ncbi:MAG TPA: hypothetical protein VGL71_01540, partial [Urbifossiella sp.]
MFRSIKRNLFGKLFQPRKTPVRRAAPSIRPHIERIEERVVPATITWNTTAAPTGGDWDTAANWNGGVIPSATDDAVISLTSSGTVNHFQSNSDVVRTLTTNSNT